MDPRWGRLAVEALATDLRGRLAGVPPGFPQVERAVRHFFRDRGFRPLPRGEMGPRDWLLEEVLRRHRGAGLVLALLFGEVVRRAGLPLEFVELEGRVLLQYRGPEGTLLLDPAEGGRLRVRAPQDDPAASAAAVPNRSLLTLLLRRLKEAYREADDLDRVGRVADLLLVLDADSARDRRDRGLARMEQGNFVEAKGDFRRYLELEPDAPDAAVIRSYLEEIDVRVRALSRAFGSEPFSR